MDDKDGAAEETPEDDTAGDAADDPAPAGAGAAHPVSSNPSSASDAITGRRGPGSPVTPGGCSRPERSRMTVFLPAGDWR